MLKHISRDKQFYLSILALSAPMILQNMINSSMSLLDTFMVGTLGETYMAGVTLANTVFFVVALVVFGLQSGSAVLISQYHGKGDRTTINRVMGIGFGLSFAVSLAAAILTTVIPEQIYSLTTNDPELVAVASEYARIVAFSFVLNSLTMMYLSAQRSMENPRLGLTVLSISVVSNTFLNWVFIFGKLGMPALGVKGAALATLLARILEFAITFWFAFRVSDFKLEFRALTRPGKLIFSDFMRFSVPVVVNETLWGFGFSLYAVIFGHMENAVAGVAAYTITLNVERLLSAFNFGVGSAASILVGKELGAGRRESAYTAGVTMLALSVGLGVVTGLIMAVLTQAAIVPYLFPLFGASPLTQRIGQSMLLIMSLTIPCRSYNFCCIVGVLRGGGDVKAGVFLDMAAMYGVALPLAAIMGLVVGADILLVYVCMSMEEIVKVILGIWRFRQKKWLQNVTRSIATADA